MYLSGRILNSEIAWPNILSAFERVQVSNAQAQKRFGGLSTSLWDLTNFLHDLDAPFFRKLHDCLSIATI
jgi:hypothetical protein